MSEAQREELARLLALPLSDVMTYGGVSIPAGHDYREEYMDRAQGKPPAVIGKPYWDNPRRQRALSGQRARKRNRLVRPKSGRARSRRNPRSEMDRARDQFRKWHEFEPEGRVTRVKAPTRVPKVMARLGELVSVVYRSDKYDGKSKLYEHTTKRPRPVLATDPDGRSVFIVGGNMKVTGDGLVN